MCVRVCVCVRTCVRARVPVLCTQSLTTLISSICSCSALTDIEAAAEYKHLQYVVCAPCVGLRERVCCIFYCVCLAESLSIHLPRVDILFFVLSLCVCFACCAGREQKLSAGRVSTGHTDRHAGSGCVQEQASRIWHQRVSVSSASQPRRLWDREMLGKGVKGESARVRVCVLMAVCLCMNQFSPPQTQTHPLSHSCSVRLVCRQQTAGPGQRGTADVDGAQPRKQPHQNSGGVCLLPNAATA